MFITSMQGKRHEMEVDPAQLVNTVVQQVADKEGIDPAHIRLIFAGRQLSGERTLTDYNITQESTLHVLIMLRGA